MLSLRRQFDHITQVLKYLHWLPVEQRIEYKVLLFTNKTLHGKAPAYISQFLSLYTPTRPLRSENKNLLRVQRCHLQGFGRRSFAYGAPSLHLLNVPLPLIPSRAAWRLTCLMWHIPGSTDCYIVWVYCCDSFSVFYLQALLSTVTCHHFSNQRYMSETLLFLSLTLSLLSLSLWYETLILWDDLCRISKKSGSLDARYKVMFGKYSFMYELLLMCHLYLCLYIIALFLQVSDVIPHDKHMSL